MNAMNIQTKKKTHIYYSWVSPAKTWLEGCVSLFPYVYRYICMEILSWQVEHEIRIGFKLLYQAQRTCTEKSYLWVPKHREHI